MFKFYSASSELATAVLGARTVKFTAPTDFNDPFECAPQVKAASDAELDEYCSELTLQSGISTLQAQLRIAAKSLKFNLRLHERNLLRNTKEAVKNVGVACFSRNCTSILMWSHYATAHKGFCVDYIDPEPVSEHFGHTQPVRYTRDYPTISFVDYCKLQDFAHFGIWAKDFERLSKAFSASAFLTKSPEWQYEEEVRCVRPPVRGGAGLVSLPPQYIKGVILGAKHSEELATHVRCLLATSLPHAYLATAEISDGAYEVRILRSGGG